MDARIWWIGLGGMAGSVARYLMSGWVLTWLGPAFPWGTLSVNLLGSFLLGVLAQIGQASDWMGPTTRTALTIGVMGGFTTYSTFSLETWRLLESGAWLHAGLNVLGTVLSCLVATALGLAAGRALVGS